MGYNRYEEASYTPTEKIYPQVKRRNPLIPLVIVLVSITVTLAVSLTAVLIIHFGSPSNPLVSPQKPVSGESASCPSKTDIANQIGDSVSLVRPLQGWPCDFKLQDGIERKVHCPSSFDASFEATSANGDIVIFWCPKGDSRSFIIWGATLYDASVDIQGDACTVHAKHPGSSVDGKSC